MLANAYGPERMLHAGKVYLLPDDVADQLLAPYQPPLESVDIPDPRTGVLARTMKPMALPPWRFAELVTDKTVKAIQPGLPDPEDRILDSEDGAADGDDWS